MKANKILVGANGAVLALTGGNGVAVYPAQKGDDHSMVLLDSGKVVRLKGARIQGVGVTRYLTEHGFVPGTLDDPQVAKLADAMDEIDGLKLVEKASNAQAEKLQRELAGKTFRFVPFEEAQPIETVVVEQPGSFRTYSMDIADAITCGSVSVEYTPGSRVGTSISLSKGWIAALDGSPLDCPRVTEYDGPVGHAAYVICNVGLATLVGEPHLAMDEDAAEDAPFPRGKLELQLSNDDRIQIGIDGGDELVVMYQRAGETLYTRNGISGTRLGTVVGSIAAVMVRVAALDALKAKKPLKKAA